MDSCRFSNDGEQSSRERASSDWDFPLRGTNQTATSRELTPKGPAGNDEAGQTESQLAL
jgi:hypothetical protein